MLPDMRYLIRLHSPSGAEPSRDFPYCLSYDRRVGLLSVPQLVHTIERHAPRLILQANPRTEPPASANASSDVRPPPVLPGPRPPTHSVTARANRALRGLALRGS